MNFADDVICDWSLVAPALEVVDDGVDAAAAEQRLAAAVALACPEKFQCEGQFAINYLHYLSLPVASPCAMATLLPSMTMGRRAPGLRSPSVPPPAMS